MEDNKLFFNQQQTNQRINYNTNSNNNGTENFEPNYSYMETPVNFYTQPNYGFTPTFYSQTTGQWNTNTLTDSTKFIGNSNNWAYQQPFYNTIPATPYNPRVLVEQNHASTPIHHPAPVQVKTNPYINNQQYTATITHTDQYKVKGLDIENKDPNLVNLNQNNNARKPRQIESETSIAAQNLAAVFSQDTFSEETESQDSNSSEANKQTPKGRMRCYKRKGTRELADKICKPELISMKLRGNPAISNTRGPHGDSEPPTKIRVMNQPTDGTKFQKYQFSSNVHTLQPKHIISWYCDYLIGENEEVTEMSKSFTMPGNIFACDDFYYMDSLQKDVDFPTPKFREWMKNSFPSIDIEAVEFFKDNQRRIHIDQEEYWKSKPAHEIIKEVFYHFQEKRVFRV